MSYNQDEKRDRKNLLWAALAILTLLNIVTLYFFFQERQENTTKDSVIASKTQEVLSAQRKLDSISVELDAKILQVQQLGGQVDSLVALKALVEKDKAALASNVSGFSAKNYDAKIRNYEALLTQKDDEITKLREELGVVTAQNETLNEQVSGLQTDKQALNDSVTTYSAKNKALSEKVTLASALKAEKVTVNAVSEKGKERDGGKYRAKRIDKIKVSFNLAENAVAEQNEKDIYLKVLDPDGAVLSDMATGSGTFTYNGRETIYSSKQTIQFTNSNQPVSIFYGRGSLPMKDGKYVIELYSEGFKIGQSSFTVR